VAVTTPLTLTPPDPVINLLLRSKLPPSCGVVSLATSAEITTVAIPAAPELAVTVTPLDPLKSIVDTLPAVPTVEPLSSLIVRPPIAPVPDAVIPVKLEPSIAGRAPVSCAEGKLVKFAPEPANVVAVTVPSTSSFVLGNVEPIPTLPSVKYALYASVPAPTLKGLMAITVVPIPTFLDA